MGELTMYTNDIIESLTTYYNIRNKDERIILLDCLKELYETSHEYLYLKKFEELCNKENICKQCYAQLVTESHKERRGENETFDETIYETKCPKCGGEYYKEQKNK